MYLVVTVAMTQPLFEGKHGVVYQNQCNKLTNHQINWHILYLWEMYVHLWMHRLCAENKDQMPLINQM